MNKAFVFDFDDTLATTGCRVLVRRPNGRGTRGLPVRRLTPAEFNTDVLDEGEEYDFSQFRSAQFIRSANPTFFSRKSITINSILVRVSMLWNKTDQ